MSRSSFAIKLRPAKKAWRSFTTALRSRIRNLNIPTTVKTAGRRFSSALHTLYFFIAAKRGRSLTKSSFSRKHDVYHYHQGHFQQSFKAVHIDELFSEAVAMQKRSWDENAGTSRGGEAGEVEMDLRRKAESNSIYSVEDAWSVVVASSPQLRGVDERADEFISKFRQDMRIQRERSILEHQKMLARGT